MISSKKLALLSSICFAVGCSDTNEALQELDAGSVSAPPQKISLSIQNYKPQEGFVLEHMFVSNFSLKVKRGQLSYSSSRDGLSDQLKLSLAPSYGFSVDNPESSGSGYSDLLLYLTGITLEHQGNLFCPSSRMGSSSQDIFVYQDDRDESAATRVLGLRDCEKDYLDLDRNTFDSDGDGIPDYLELRCGLNPLNPYDAQASTSGDGVTNLDKCKMNIPVDELSTSQANRFLSYNYNFELKEDGFKALEVSEIPVLDGGMENFIAIYIVERSPGSNQRSLSTAFILPKDKSHAGKIIEFDYWATSEEYRRNQEIVLQ